MVLLKNKLEKLELSQLSLILVQH